MSRPLADVVEAGWAQALAPVSAQIAAMGEFLRAEVAAGRTYLPAGPLILRAFTQPFADVRVLIVGQDPYPTPGHPVGLSFSVEPDVSPVPRSLQNIYRELQSDLGLPTPSNGDLTPWSRHGVLLLNRCPRSRRVSPRRIAARAGRRSPTRRSGRWSTARRRWSRSSGAATRSRSRRCSRPSPGSSPRTRRRCRPTASSWLEAVQPRQRRARRPGRRPGRLVPHLTLSGGSDQARRAGKPPVATGPHRRGVTRSATCPGRAWPGGTRPSRCARR